MTPTGFGDWSLAEYSGLGVRVFNSGIRCQGTYGVFV